MAIITLTDLYSNLDDWPGNLLTASDGVTIGTRTATNFTYTYNGGTTFAGFSVSMSGNGFTYDGSTPTGGTMSRLVIKDAGGGTVLTVANIKAISIASDLALFASYQFGWTDPDGGGSGAQQKNAWSQLLAGNDVYTGTAGDDDRAMVGVDAGNDQFNMGAGDDVVNGGLGNDTINGGDGYDRLSYRETHWNEGIPMVRGITVNVDAGRILDPYEFTDRFTGIEAIQGSAARDVFIGGTSEMEFAGLRGADRIVGGAEDFAVYYEDTWLGGNRGIVVKLQTSIVGGDVRGTIRDGFGTLDTTVNIFNVAGTRYNDSFTGSTKDDYFAGGEGKDTYNGGAGTDWINFNWNFADNDAQGINVDLRKPTGQIIDDGFGNKETAKSIENVIGSFGNDRIIGSSEDNMIRGHRGNDTMTGAGGADTFRWRDASENGGNEVITDFHAGAGADQDILSFGMSNEGLSTTLTLVIGTAATAAGVETFVFNPTTRVLSLDADGAGGGRHDQHRHSDRRDHPDRSQFRPILTGKAALAAGRAARSQRFPVTHAPACRCPDRTGCP